MFAVIGEELGFVGIAVVLGLFLLILVRYLKIASASEDDFAALLLVGLGAILLIHVVVNAGMNLRILPITGIPMPFVSAAASNLLVALIAIGIAESVAVRRRSA
jgi:rod shape determining protein RodA